MEHLDVLVNGFSGHLGLWMDTQCAVESTCKVEWSKPPPPNTHLVHPTNPLTSLSTLPCPGQDGTFCQFANKYSDTKSALGKEAEAGVNLFHSNILHNLLIQSWSL